MIKKTSSLIHQAAAVMAVGLCFAGILNAADVTVYDSVVSLATNATKNYAFTDPASGQSVIVAVTMTPYDPANGAATFSTLDGGSRVATDGNVMLDGSGANFSAAVVSASSGVTAGTVRFRIAGLGIRPVDGSGSLTWTSSVAGLSIPYSSTAEVIQPLDTTTLSLSGATYAAKARFPENNYFQFTDVPAPGQSIVFNVTFTAVSDPNLSSWFTADAGKYARITTNDTARTAGNSITTWNNGVPSETQTLPAYCGVQELYTSAGWVYLRSTGLGSHTMGPWYNDATRTTLFINWPVNQKILYRIPRTSTLTNPPAVKNTTAGMDAAVAYLVDGVAMFDPTDGFSYSGGTEASPGTGQWHQDAFINEAITFDAGNSHQQNTGTYHNHADPIALRYLLGDNILINQTNGYNENIANTNLKHSPILAWVRDGLPLYGPYGYSNPTNPASGIRRMVSGFVLRNGLNGTDNLTNTARATLPAWMLRNNGNTAASGPAVSATYPLGRYCQDNAYLGDLTNPVTSQKYILGSDYDLNEYNVRWCVTPEFPNGTYAYFVTISSNGTPTYPYNMNYYFYGNPTGGTITNIAEAVTTNFLGNINLVSRINTPTVLGGSFISLKWSGIDGGSYQVDATTNLTSWNTLATGLSITSYASNTVMSSYLDSVGTLNKRFYRISRTAVASFDPVTGTAGGIPAQGITSVAPASGNHGVNNLSLTITLNSSYTPPPPPANNLPSSITLTRNGAATITATSSSRNSTTGIVTATFNIPSGATLGAYTVNAIFGPNTWSLTNGFTVN